ncbi:MAG: molybdopterin-dependent oxidoreductase [Burkholderiaceae bacterium]|nr:molybdopterin-dependent oxidoreductase [Burkholderiaceae bacterium]
MDTRSTCPYCGVGCGVVIESDGACITGVRGDPEHPANFGRLCSKGATLHLTAAPEITRQARLLQPMQRLTRDADPVPLAWDGALDLAADRIAGVVQAHGADAVGVYVSGQLLTEDYFVFNKLVRGLLGSNQIDSNSRLCMSSAVAGYKATLGADAPPACYDDLAHANTVFIAGSNTAWAHPILMRRLEDAKRANPAQKWIVADPRRTETAAVADLHLPLLPGTDVALFHGLLHLLLWEGLTDAAFIAAHTTGFDALRDRVREFTPKHVAALCGIPETDIVQAARWFGANTPTLSLYCQGLNQSSHGTDKNAALINLHLATGQIGKPGAGPFSLTGQPNAMGGREVGAMANLLPGHRSLASDADRAELAALWGVPPVPAAPGRTAVEMFEAAADGAVKLLWIACTNPAQSLPDQAMVRRALARAEFVIVQEAFADTATARRADLLLPAATWGEKEGTVTNSERRISRVRAAVPPAGEARPDWQIARDVGRRLEARLDPRRADGASLFAFESAEQVWHEHRATTVGRDLDIGGLDWGMLDAAPRQWPLPAGAADGLARLYGDGRFPTPDGRARFAAPAWQDVAQPRDARFPVALTTGRLRDQWHGMSRTGLLGRLNDHAPAPALAVHPQELDRRGWRAGDLVRVRSRHGEAVLPVQPSATVRPAQASVPMHWGEEFVGGQTADGRPLTGVNALASPARCPQSEQPELKHVAVRVEPAKLPWRLTAAAWLPAEAAVAARATLSRHLPDFGYAQATLFGREGHGEPVGVLLHAAASASVADEVLARVEALLGLDVPEVLRYSDPRRGQRRLVRLAAGAPVTLAGLLLAGDDAAATWALPLLQGRLPADGLARGLLSGSARALSAAAPRAPQVCNCLDVREDRIVDALQACHGNDAARLATVQQALGCGTQCGSCVPALQALVRRTPPTPTLEAEAA